MTNTQKEEQFIIVNTHSYPLQFTEATEPQSITDLEGKEIVTVEPEVTITVDNPSVLPKDVEKALEGLIKKYKKSDKPAIIYVNNMVYNLFASKYGNTFGNVIIGLQVAATERNIKPPVYMKGVVSTPEPKVIDLKPVPVPENAVIYNLTAHPITYIDNNGQMRQIPQTKKVDVKFEWVEKGVNEKFKNSGIRVLDSIVRDKSFIDEIGEFARKGTSENPAVIYVSFFTAKALLQEGIPLVTENYIIMQPNTIYDKEKGKSYMPSLSGKTDTQAYQMYYGVETEL